MRIARILKISEDLLITLLIEFSFYMELENN